MSATADRTLRVLFFAKAREIAGGPTFDFSLDAGIQFISCADLLHRICVRYHLEVIEANVILSVNGELHDDTSAVLDLDGVHEIAVIPPISGG